MKKVHDVSIPISKNLVLWPDDPGIKMELSKKILGMGTLRQVKKRLLTRQN